MSSPPLRPNGGSSMSSRVGDRSLRRISFAQGTDKVAAPQRGGRRHNKGRRARGGKAMPDRLLEFEFEVGESERHSVAFRFDQLWGPLKISVDGNPVIKKFEMFTLRPTRHYEFSVGSSEP